MRREEFEQLVSDWLDEPGRPELRARIEAAVAESAECAAMLAAWRRAGEILREPLVLPVDWPRLKLRISAAVDDALAAGEAGDAALDAALQRLPAVEARVDWGRLRDRISDAVADDARRRRFVRIRRRLGAAVALTGLAAAAGLVAVLLPRGEQPASFPTAIADTGIANVSIVGGSSGTAAGGATGVAYARVTAEAAEPQPELLFVLDSRVPSPSGEDLAGLY